MDISAMASFPSGGEKYFITALLIFVLFSLICLPAVRILASYETLELSFLSLL